MLVVGGNRLPGRRQDCNDDDVVVAATLVYSFRSGLDDYSAGRHLDDERTGAGGEIQITDTMRLMLEDGLPVWGVRMGDGERRLDIGNYRSYFRAFLEMALIDPDLGAEFTEFARARLDEDAE